MTVLPAAVEEGYVTPAFVGAVGLTMVLLVMFANVLVIHYARGVMQAAIEEGARQGTAVGSAEFCVQRASDVVTRGLGAMAASVDQAGCTVAPGQTLASMQATFRPWLPVLPTQTVSVRALVTSAGGGP
ncbi:MAG: hypothetical protein ACR2HR_04300 [Euzebya sp.]